MEVALEPVLKTAVHCCPYLNLVFVKVTHFLKFHIYWGFKEANYLVESCQFCMLVLPLGILRIKWPPTFWFCLHVCKRVFT